MELKLNYLACLVTYHDRVKGELADAVADEKVEQDNDGCVV